MEKKKKLSLPAQIFIALVLGIVVGLIFYFAGAADFTTNYVKPFGDIFVNLLKFIVVPVVLLSMIDGIISMGNMKKVGSVGWKTVVYFMITTAIACVIGLALASMNNDEGAAQSFGINVSQYKILSFTIGTAIAGMTGCIYAHRMGIIFSSNFSTMFFFTPSIVR